MIKCQGNHRKKRNTHTAYTPIGKNKEEAKNETAEVNTKTLTSTVNLQELNLPVKMDKNESN